jgi:hypothetical protein
VVDQSTGAFVQQFPISTALNAGSFASITLSFTSSLAHGNTYSFTLTSNLGNSAVFYAKAT